MTAYRPQSNGSLERAHAPLNEFLRHFCNEKPDDWDEFIEFAAFCHNLSTHQSHNFTPYELTFAREAREPCVRPCEKDKTYGDYFTSLVNKLSDIQIKAHDRLIEAKWRSKLNYDKQLRSNELKIGDKVYLRVDRTRKKLDPTFEGPFEVIDVLNNKNVTQLCKIRKNFGYIYRL